MIQPESRGKADFRLLILGAAIGWGRTLVRICGESSRNENERLLLYLPLFLLGNGVILNFHRLDGWPVAMLCAMLEA